MKVSSLNLHFAHRGLFRFAAVSVLFCACASLVKADSRYWGAAVTGGTSLWLTSTNWFADADELLSGTTPTLSDDVFFNTTPDNAQGGTVSVTGTIFANSLNYNTSGTMTLTQSSSPREFYLGGGGISLGASSGQLTVGTSTSTLSVRLTSSQTWTNNSNSILNVRSLRASDTAPGPVALTLNASGSGAITFNLAIQDSPDATKTLGLIIDSAGGGNVSIAGGSYSGGTIVNRGLLSTSGSIGSGSVLLGGTSGSFDARINATAAVTNTITVRAGSSGLAALTVGTNGDYQGNIILNRDVALGSVAASGLTGAYSGVISGTYGVSIGRVATGSSNPTVIMSGSSTYTGKTTIHSATVDVLSLNKVVGGSATSSLGAPSAGNGTIAMSQISASTLRYSGTGETTDRTIEMVGNAGATLNQNGIGNVNFAGGVTSSGSGSRTLTLRGTSAGTGEISGVIDNAGGGFNTSVTKTDAGTWRLSGSNLFGGNLSLNGGILEVTSLANSGSASPLGAASTLVFSSGTLRYVGSGDSTNRSFTVGAAGGAIDASGFGPVNFTNSGAFSHGSTSPGRTFTLTGTNTGLNTFASGVTNAGGSGLVTLIKEGAGTWVLTGTSQYSGGTTISAGTLLANTVVSGSNSALGRGAVAVNAGTLGGTGQIAPNAANGISVASGAFIAPGASIGTLTVNLGSTTGGVSLVSGAGFKFELGTANGSIGTIAGGSSDLLAISGAAASDVSFGGNVIDLLGTASGAGFYKLFDTDLDATTWTGLTIGGVTTGGNLITAGLTASNFGGMFTGNLILADGSAGTSAGDIYLQVLVIPEPGTFAMLISGVGMLTLFRRRSHRSTQQL